MDRAKPVTAADGGRSRRTGGRGRPAAPRSESRRSNVNTAAFGGRLASDRGTAEGARALRPEQPLLAGDRVEVDPGRPRGDRDRAGRLGAVDDDGRAAGMGERRDPLDRHPPRRPQDVAEDRPSGSARRSRASNAATIASSSPPSPTSGNSISAPDLARPSGHGPTPPGCSGLGRHDPVARLAGRPRSPAFMPGSSNGRARCRRHRPPRRPRRTPGPRPFAPGSRMNPSACAATDPELVVRPSRSIAAAVSAGRGPDRPVFR